MNVQEMVKDGGRLNAWQLNTLNDASPRPRGDDKYDKDFSKQNGDAFSKRTRTTRSVITYNSQDDSRISRHASQMVYKMAPF